MIHKEIIINILKYFMYAVVSLSIFMLMLLMFVSGIQYLEIPIRGLSTVIQWTIFYLITGFYITYKISGGFKK